VQTFASSREAKDFLVSRIVTQAEREGLPLSEVERKMLYFSETAWTLPDMAEVNDTFDRKYDQTEYEQKIAKLVGNFRSDARADAQHEFEAWTAAVQTLSREDRYLLVLISTTEAPVRRRGDFLKLVAVALIIVGVVIAITFLVSRI
jgi:hypothetical protein